MHNTTHLREYEDALFVILIAHMSEVPEENGARLVLERSKKTLTREERIAFGFIAGCGIGGVILGGLFFWSNIKKPFLISYSGPRYATASQKESEQAARQRITDSDADGISDYDELNIFFSSPYIVDSDSDGRADGVEISEGSDPNCALGKACASSEGTQKETIEVDFLNETPSPVQGSETSAPTIEQTLSELSKLSAQEIRALLSESGVDKDTLETLSDEQVMVLYQEALSQAAIQVQETSDTSEPATP